MGVISDVERLSAVGLWEPGDTASNGKTSEVSNAPAAAQTPEPDTEGAAAAAPPLRGAAPMQKAVTASVSPPNAPLPLQHEGDALGPPIFDDIGPSVISPKLKMKGSIVTPDELHIYGTVDGDVQAASLVVCKGGVVRGEVVAETVVVHGTVEGSIQGKTVQLFAGARVRGDIVHDAMAIDFAAVFEGASKRTSGPANEKAGLSVV
jgi:cytoskeletal protein CcmA (bactofilin family)